MSLLTSIQNMNSGLVASQKGLQVTSNNLANINTKGYIRKQVLQQDSKYIQNANVNIGHGVSITEIRQIRDEMLDKRFRTENTAYSFYRVQSSVISGLEDMIGLEGEYSLDKLTSNIWTQLQNLSNNPSGDTERISFIKTCGAFLNGIQVQQNELKAYQLELDEQIQTSVAKINELLYTIKSLNDEIAGVECKGDKANDIRDLRNLALDELSEYVEIMYYEDNMGRIAIQSEGNQLLDGPFVMELELRQNSTPQYPDSAFVKPVWKYSGEDMYETLNLTADNNKGRLKSLLIARGNGPADHITEYSAIIVNEKYEIDIKENSYTIPAVQKKLANYVYEIMNAINTCFQQGVGEGEFATISGTSVFVTITGEVLEKSSMEDIRLNPILQGDKGYQALGTSKSGDPQDNSLINELLCSWEEEKDWIIGGKIGNYITRKLSFKEYYSSFITELGSIGNYYSGKYREKYTILHNIENDRLSMSGVSQDEELSNMLKYQHAYSAAARIITVMDQMLEHVVQRL